MGFGPLLELPFEGDAGANKYDACVDVAPESPIVTLV